MKNTVVIEKSDDSYSAYLPDLRGCIAAGDTLGETEDLIRQGVIYDLEMLRESGDLDSRTTGYDYPGGSVGLSQLSAATAGAIDRHFSSGYRAGMMPLAGERRAIFGRLNLNPDA